jgi:hypothetical protein
MFGGHIAELICVDGAVSAANRLALTAYLKNANGTA